MKIKPTQPAQLELGLGLGRALQKKILKRGGKMERGLGLDKLADDLGKTSKGFMNDLDLMYSSDESD